MAACGYLGGGVDAYRPPVYYGSPDLAPGTDALELGRHLYLRDCAFCHGSTGGGTDRAGDLVGGTNGPALTDFVLRTGRMPVPAPVDQTKPGPPRYTEEQMAAIVAYVTREFRPRGPDIPRVDAGRGDLAVGQQLYQEHCASCHATTGIGGAMLIQAGEEVPGRMRGITIPDFGYSDALAVAEAVRTGPGAMPVFGTRAISEHDLDSLVRYTLYLKNPRDPGGAPIGRVGPVVEGAVGWLLGLGALLAFTRWIGTTARSPVGGHGHGVAPAGRRGER
jgi:ubiquinol-cytochrome c reductase cytochrome c subunit